VAVGANASIPFGRHCAKSIAFLKHFDRDIWRDGLLSAKELQGDQSLCSVVNVDSTLEVELDIHIGARISSMIYVDLQVLQ